ncbi:MAG: S-layer protein, partial [Verrucomicrobia bacterium]|nr:S-layer protein [Verrucomicrobiota bacterium]
MKHLALISAICLAFVAHGAESVVLLPPNVTLTGVEARQTLLVERVQGQQLVGQVTNGVELSSSNPGVVRIDHGVARPIANGAATVRARVRDRTATAQITVVDADKPFAWSFRNQVEPVLAKMGCSSGACHGAAAGKNGFKLSL